MAHPSLVKGVGLGARSKEAIDREWSNLASKLNAHGDGATKTGQRWKRYWADLKFKIKTKAALRRKEASGTGGGPATQPDFSEIENKILSIIGEGAVHGDSEHRVPILISLPPNKTDTQGIEAPLVEVTVNTTESPPPSVPASFRIISPSTRGHTSRVDTTEATAIAPGSPHRPATSRRIFDTTEATAVAPGSPHRSATSRRIFDTTEATAVAPGSPRQPGTSRRILESPISRRQLRQPRRGNSSTSTRVVRTDQRVDPSWVIDLERRRVDAESRLAEAAIITAEAARTQAEAARVHAQAALVQAEMLKETAAAIQKLVDIIAKK